MTNDFEAKVKRLEDIEAIKQLLARYCYYVDQCLDDKKLINNIVEFFTRDAVVYFGPYSNNKKIEGHDAIRTQFENLNLKYTFAVHMLSNPVIEVNGDTAKGTWYYEVPCTHTRNNIAVWINGRYDNELVREKDGWKFTKMICTFHYVTPYSEGWAKQRDMGIIEESYSVAGEKPD